jgi:hypothetical protein
MANQHRCQPRTDALPGQPLYLISNFLFDFGGNRRAVEYLWHRALQRFIVSLSAPVRALGLCANGTESSFLSLTSK